MKVIKTALTILFEKIHVCKKMVMSFFKHFEKKFDFWFKVYKIIKKYKNKKSIFIFFFRL